MVLRAGLAVLLVMLSGCGMLRSFVAQPEVSIAAIRLGQTEGFYQPLFIDLVILNPGRQDLALAALHYRIRLEGHDLVRGTSREPLRVAAGETARYTVPAGINLLSSLGFARDLLSRPRDRIRYELEASLEPEGVYWRPIEVRQADYISLGGSR